MSVRLGLAVGEGELLAAAVEGIGPRARVSATLRVPFAGPTGIEEALRQVGERFRQPRVALAPAASDVWIKLVALPPLPPADRVRMLEMEAERYFPVRGEPVVVDSPAAGLVTAARAADVEALVLRVEESVGPVRAVVPAPLAAVRAWCALDRSLRGRPFAVVSRRGRWWDLAVARGDVLLGYARFLAPEPRALADALAAAVEPGGLLPRILLVGEDDAAELVAALEGRLPGAIVERRRELVRGVPAELAPAVGLALGPPGGLLPAGHRARLERGAQRRTAAWAGAAALAGLLMLSAGPWTRSRSAAELAAEARRLAPRADSATVLLRQVHDARARVAFTDSLTRARPDWLGALAELTRRLPQGSYLTSLRGDAASGTLEVQGYAGSASAIVPLLEQSPRFSEVESTEPIARRAVGGVELENFSVRLKVGR